MILVEQPYNPILPRGNTSENMKWLRWMYVLAYCCSWWRDSYGSWWFWLRCSVGSCSLTLYLIMVVLDVIFSIISSDDVHPKIISRLINEKTQGSSKVLKSKITYQVTWSFKDMKERKCKRPPSRSFA